MCSFITQHNATDVTVLREHVIGVPTAGISTRAVARELMFIFIYHKPSPNVFQIIWQYIQPASQPQTTCTTSAQDLQSSIFTSKIVWNSPPDSCCKQSVYIPKEFLWMSQGSSSACSASSSGSRPDCKFVVVTDLSGQMPHIRWCLALWRGVLFTDESLFSLYRADGRQRVWRRVGERFADVNVVDWVAHVAVGVMVWTTNTSVFYWCHLNAQR